MTRFHCVRESLSDSCYSSPEESLCPKWTVTELNCDRPRLSVCVCETRNQENSGNGPQIHWNCQVQSTAVQPSASVGHRNYRTNVMLVFSSFVSDKIYYLYLYLRLFYDIYVYISGLRFIVYLIIVEGWTILFEIRSEG